MAGTMAEGPPPTGLLQQPLSYGTRVLVGGIRGKILGNGWIEGIVQKQHPSGRVTVRIRGRNHVVSGKEVIPRSISFTVRVPADLSAPAPSSAPPRTTAPQVPEHWWVDDDGLTVRDENRLIVATAAGPDDAQLIARAPAMEHAIARALERLEHETGAPLGSVLAQLKAALEPRAED